MIRFILSVLFLGFAILVFSQPPIIQDCEIPDTVYIFFEKYEGTPPEYSDKMRKFTQEDKIEFWFGYPYSQVFYSECGESFKIISDPHIYDMKLFDISDLFRMESNYFKCKNEEMINKRSVIVPSHRNSFKYIYLLEKVDQTYYLHKVLWADIEYD